MTAMEPAQASEERRLTEPAGSARAAPQVGLASWWMVGVLFTLNVLAMLDRLILTMLVGPIKAELLLSDFRMSLILGPAFAVFYALFGVPLGWASDRFPRRMVIFFGVTMWGLATVASGLARSFEWLLLARICVGVGEAALAPAAVSLMADAFPRERLTTAIACYQSAAKIGSAVAMGLGGAAIALATALLAAHPAILGVSRPWHLVMMMVGAPGVVLAGLVFTFREPRRELSAATGAGKARGGELAAFVARRWQLWAAMMIGFCAISIVGFSLTSWVPTYFARHFGWTPVQFGPALSLTNVIAAGSLVVNGWLVDLLYRRGIRDIHLRFYRWLILAVAPAILVLFFIPNPLLFLVLFALVQFVTVPFLIYVSAVIAMLAPSRLRGRLTAIYLAAFTVIGQGLGPPMVGALTDFVFRDEAQVGRSLAVVLVGGTIVALACLQWALPHLGAAIRDNDAPA